MAPTITWDERKVEGHVANCVKGQGLQPITALTHIAENKCVIEKRKISCGLTSLSAAFIRKASIHATCYCTCINDKNRI